MHYYYTNMVIYLRLSWFCKLGVNKSELRAKIDGSELLCAFHARVQQLN